MAGIRDLPRLDEQQHLRRACPKPVRVKKARTTLGREYDKFRDLIWRLDESRSRASGLRLLRGSDDLDRGGAVAHLKPRGSHPELRFDPRNACLLSNREHQDSDPRTADGGKVLLDIRGTNANRSLTFIRRDVDGRELWRRTSTRKAQ